MQLSNYFIDIIISVSKNVENYLEYLECLKLYFDSDTFFSFPDSTVKLQRGIVLSLLILQDFSLFPSETVNRDMQNDISLITSIY